MAKCKNCTNLHEHWCEKIVDSPCEDTERECDQYKCMTQAEVLRKHNVGRYLWKDDDLVEELDRALASHYPEDLDNVRRYLQNAIDHLDLIESECKAENK